MHGPSINHSKVSSVWPCFMSRFLRPDFVQIFLTMFYDKISKTRSCPDFSDLRHDKMSKTRSCREVILVMSCHRIFFTTLRNSPVAVAHLAQHEPAHSDVSHRKSCARNWLAQLTTILFLLMYYVRSTVRTVHFFIVYLIDKYRNCTKSLFSKN